MKEIFHRAVQEGMKRGGNLELASPARAPGGVGRRSGNRSGNALEFSEYREYQAGDDLRRLDWSVYARSEQLMVKLFHEEIDPRCDLILDVSASMSASGDEKSAAMLALAALLAQAAVNSGFSLEVWHAGGELLRENAPRHPLEWEVNRFDSPAGPEESLSFFAGRFQRRGIRIALTDLLWPQEPDLFLRRLADGAMRTVIIQLLSDEDLFPVGTGNTLVIDAESGEERELFFDEELLACYRERLSRHHALWDRKAEEHGVRLIRLKAGELYPGWNLEELFQAGVLK